MKPSEAIEKLKDILEEATETEYAVCYVTSCDEEPLRMAIKALEKQIPKKLIETEEFVEGSCQNCKRNIGWIKDEYFDFDNCPFCGQAIDWSDTE